MRKSQNTHQEYGSGSSKTVKAKTSITGMVFDTTKIHQIKNIHSVCYRNNRPLNLEFRKEFADHIKPVQVPRLAPALDVGHSRSL